MNVEEIGRLEGEIRETVQISRHCEVQSAEFRRVFDCVRDYNPHGFSAATLKFWKNLILIVSIIRKRPGASLAEIVEKSSLSASEVRRCIRLIINLGGEVEVRCHEWQGVTEKRFFLHN